MKWYCPVCGYDLTEYAKDRDPQGLETDILKTGDILYTTICPCCGIQFGMGDMGHPDAYEHDKKFYQSWRQKWISGGMKWKHCHPEIKEYTENPPLNWNPAEQLKNIPEKFK